MFVNLHDVRDKLDGNDEYAAAKRFVTFVSSSGVFDRRPPNGVIRTRTQRPSTRNVLTSRGKWSIVHAWQT